MSVDLSDKPRLQLSPQQLTRNKAILHSLHINKLNGVLKHDAKEPDTKEINNFLFSLPKPFKELLLQFSEDKALARESQIRAKFKTGRSGMAYADY